MRHRRLLATPYVLIATILLGCACAEPPRRAVTTTAVRLDPDAGVLETPEKASFAELVHFCEQGSGEACGWAATRLDEGVHGAPKDPARADEFAKRACALSDWDSCRPVAGSYRKKDPRRAFDIYFRACRTGHRQDSCSDASGVLVDSAKLLGEQYELAFTLALEGISRTAAMGALEAWIEACVATAVKKERGNLSSALNRCASILEEDVPKIRQMPNPDEEIPGGVGQVCTSFRAQMNGLVVSFTWPKACAEAGVKAPPDTFEQGE